MTENDNLLILADADGNEIKVEYLDTIEMNSREFVVLLPIDEPSDEVVILEIKETEDGSEEFLPVEDENELNSVFEIFKERMKDEFKFITNEDN